MTFTHTRMTTTVYWLEVPCFFLKEIKDIIMVIWVNIFQVEINYWNLLQWSNESFFIKCHSSSYIKTSTVIYKNVANWLLLVNKRQFWWSASITLDNNNVLIVDF